MPIRQLLILLSLLGLCLALVAIAGASNSQLYLFLPAGRWTHHVSPPPTHPAVIVLLLVASVPLSIWVGQKGIVYFTILAIDLVLSSLIGYYVYNWTPTWGQHALSIGMIVASIFAWKEKDCLE